ncbi:MAG: hypothetical protein PHS60_01075 [Zavarzinia sp.]|nr:hypothetical protein [Zavarzinia sp.]
MPPFHRAIVPLILTLSLVACAKPRRAEPPAPAPDLTAPARAAFGDHMERYQGRPLSAMVHDFGAPTRQRPGSDGGTIAIWSRAEEIVVDGKTVPQDCEVTAFIDTDGRIAGIFGGGSILYCAKVFVPPSVAITPPPPVDLYGLPPKEEPPPIP